MTECGFCGAETADPGVPDGYPRSFLPCCPACRAATPRERVAAWAKKIETRFERRRA